MLSSFSLLVGGFSLSLATWCDYTLLNLSRFCKTMLFCSFLCYQSSLSFFLSFFLFSVEF